MPTLRWSCDIIVETAKSHVLNALLYYAMILHLQNDAPHTRTWPYVA